LAMGVDMICAQGGEGGGHTGDIATCILLPKVVDAVRGKISPLTGEQVIVVGAGGIFDGRGLAASLTMGCSGVWVGTRFIASEEAGAGPFHKKSIIHADYTDSIRTTIFSGRPMRVFKNPYVLDWEENRKQEMQELQNKGVIAVLADMPNGGGQRDREVLTQEERKNGVTLSKKDHLERQLRLSLNTGACAGAISDIKPAKAIIEEMVAQAAERLSVAKTFMVSKL